MSAGKVVGAAAVVGGAYAFGGILTTLYWAHKAGGSDGASAALAGGPGQAINVFFTWPRWLYQFASARKAT